MTGTTPLTDREAALAVAFATRVTSVLAIILGRLDGPSATDTFDPQSGVESRWGELTGLAPSNRLRRHVLVQLPAVKARILSSGSSGADASAAAIDVISILLDEKLDQMEQCCRIAGAALRVALEMDHTSAAPPDSQTSWIAFELRGQAELADFAVSASDSTALEFIDALREQAGMHSMVYRNAMKSLVSA